MSGKDATASDHLHDILVPLTTGTNHCAFTLNSVKNLPKSVTLTLFVVTSPTRYAVINNIT